MIFDGTAKILNFSFGFNIYLITFGIQTNIFFQFVFATKENAFRFT